MRSSVNEKGQGAMEYLMTYGWAILVVMIVGIVMWQLGIFNMGSTSITATGFSKIKPQLAGTGMRANGDFTGVFINGLGTGINIMSGLNSNSINETMTGESCLLVISGATSVAAGDNFVLANAGGDACGTGEPGDIYDAIVQIRYSVRVGSLPSNHKETGRLRGPYES